MDDDDPGGKVKVQWLPQPFVPAPHTENEGAAVDKTENQPKKEPTRDCYLHRRDVSIR